MGLHKFEADCVISTNQGFPFPGFCKGDQIGGNATITDAPGLITTPLGSDNAGDLCYLQSATEIITTHEGSTLTLTTDGITCLGAHNIRPTGYLISGGTGRFAGASGAGTVVVSFAGGNSYLIHIDGNIKLPSEDDD